LLAATAWAASVVIAAATRTGALFVHALILRHRVVLKDFALEDPDLDAAGAIGRKCRDVP
jgi:hypothetical protein